MSKLLKETLLSATFGKRADPLEALPFTFVASAPFEVAQFMGQGAVLTLNGEFPVQDKDAPFLMLALSMSADYVIDEQEEFAEKRALNVATVGDLSLGESSAVTIGGLSGFKTIANGVADGTSTPMTVFQVMLFDPDGYCIVQGLVRTADEERYLPVFEEIAESFRMK